MEQHKISPFSAVIMSINVMVGAGIFIGPPLMAAKAGFASFLGWPIVALIFLPIVLSISTMARLFPGEGGVYGYSKTAINETAGFISGWAFYLAYTGVAALMAICLRDNIILPAFPMNPLLFNVLFVGAITVCSLMSMQVIARIQNTGTFIKLLPLLFVLMIFIFYWNPSFHISTQNVLAIPGALPLAIFGYWGFESCCSISHLIRGKKENASRVILVAFLVTMVIYTFFHIGLLHIMGASNLVTHGTKSFVNYLGLASPMLTSGIKWIISISLAFVFGNSCLSLFTMTSSTLRALAIEQTLPFSTQLTKLSKNDRPWIPVLIQGVLVFGITCTISDKSLLVALVNLGVLVSFFLTLTSLFILQRKNGSTKQMPITILAFCSWAAFCYFSWFELGATTAARFMSIFTLVGAILAGYAMYWYQRRSK